MRQRFNIVCDLVMEFYEENEFACNGLMVFAVTLIAVSTLNYFFPK